MKALIGKKLGMTQIFNEEGNVVRVTVIEAGPCVITQIKTVEKDGYSAVQIGYGDAKHQKRPQMGHLKAANASSKTLREFALDLDNETPDEATPALNIGAKLDVTNFEIGD